jgi:hypothetical protein
MRISNVMVTPTHLLTIMVLGGTVFTLAIGNLDASGADSNGLALLRNGGGLVNALRAAEAHSTGEDGRQGSGPLGDRSRSELQTH